MSSSHIKLVLHFIFETFLVQNVLFLQKRSLKSAGNGSSSPWRISGTDNGRNECPVSLKPSTLICIKKPNETAYVHRQMSAYLFVLLLVVLSRWIISEIIFELVLRHWFYMKLASQVPPSMTCSCDTHFYPQRPAAVCRLPVYTWRTHLFLNKGGNQLCVQISIQTLHRRGLTPVQ